MNKNITAGRWIAETFEGPNGPQEGVYAMVNGEHVEICDVAQCSDGVDVANARLIAAAPEMLEALKLAIEWAAKAPHPYREFEFITKARAAIAKATGGAA